MLTSSASNTDMDVDTDPTTLNDPFSFSLGDDDPSNGYFNDDVKMLTQCWVNERFAPELLNYQDELVNSLMEMLEAQVRAEIVEEKSGDTPDAAFLVVLYQQEMERVKFIIRSYLRTRLSKFMAIQIQRHTLYYLREDDYRRRLSDEELAFAERFQELVERHLTKSCLGEGLEPWQQQLDDQNDETNMVSEPDLEDAVFCRINEDIGYFQLESSDETLMMSKDNIYILRYKSIRRMLEEGKVDLV
ncbi:hypothetical protein HKX48_004747 [Thoreauomyces humboldtii]|nr:hypothetical protein HKX48_004747 [Thoreauomyces humboldtii]